MERLIEEFLVIKWSAGEVHDVRWSVFLEGRFGVTNVAM